MLFLLGVGEGVDIPTNITALGLLGVVVIFFLRRTEREDKRRTVEADSDARRVVELETKVESLQDEVLAQRKLKHDAINLQARAEGKLGLAKRLARECTCGALTRMDSLWED